MAGTATEERAVLSLVDQPSTVGVKVPCHLVEGDGPSRHLYATNTRDPKTHGALCLVNYVSFGPGGA